jgi:iron complex outermembrane receptor protein
MNPHSLAWGISVARFNGHVILRALRCWCCALFLCMASAVSLFAQSPKSVDGHVFHAEDRTPCGDALIQAWPCGTTFAAGTAGRFVASCPVGIDSLTVLAHGRAMQTVRVVEGTTHYDVDLWWLAITLEDAAVQATTSEEVAEAQEVANAGDLLTTLDRVAGIRSLDLGAGLVQPVLRGLVGSRVAVLEDGVPQVGGRWGADHGVLLDPALYGGTEWVPGGGQVWLSPEAMGGGVRLRPLGMLVQPGSRTTMGVSHRAGDARSRIYVLHRQRQGEGQWHAGVSLGRFGDRNVPQDRFTYVGRVLDIEDGRLANTGGRGGHAVLGARWEDAERGQFSLDLRASDVVQGLFPGIIGVPSQPELKGDGDRFSVDIPNQQARRIQLAGKWIRPGILDRTVRLSLSRNLRIESAPPHAHGYGPEPDSDLSLQLDERHVFVESRWEGIHGAFGFQVEHLDGRTSGWEFLLPDHLRTRASAIADRKWKAGRIGLRLDGVSVSNVDHTEPLYASDGAVVGDDVRAIALDRVMAGWALMVNQPFHVGQRLEGQWTATVYSRVPDSYSLSANGIHHGTFRFEQGNPDLKTEKTAEVRATIGSHDPTEDQRFRWSARGFAALHDGFIHLTPTASFAPIVHAGQVYAFTALDAFRTGGEVEADVRIDRGRLSTSVALLGQWALETGLGLPFTSPTEIRSAVWWPLGDKAFVRPRHRWIADANLTARNEDTTPGASLWGVELQVEGERMTLALDVDNLLNAAWLDHVSAYRTLGLVTQGRWASLRLTFDVTQTDDRS